MQSPVLFLVGRLVLLLCKWCWPLVGWNPSSRAVYDRGEALLALATVAFLGRMNKWESQGQIWLLLSTPHQCPELGAVCHPPAGRDICQPSRGIFGGHYSRDACHGYYLLHRNQGTDKCPTRHRAALTTENWASMIPTVRW